MLKNYDHPSVFTPQKFLQAVLQGSGLTSLPLCGTEGNCIGSIGTISFCADGISDASELVGLKYTFLFDNDTNQVCSDPDGKISYDIVAAENNGSSNCPSGIGVTIQVDFISCQVTNYPVGCIVNFSNAGNTGVTNDNDEYIPCEGFGAI